MKIFAFASLFTMCVVATPLQAQVSDGGFEQQGAISTSGYCYFGRATGGGAACGDGSWRGDLYGGLQAETNGDWPGIPTSDGGYYAFIQAQGSVTQDLAMDAGVYSLSWLAAGRSPGCCGGDQRYDVVLDGAVVFSGATRTGQQFTAMSADPVTVSAGRHTLTFQGLIDGDQTAFIDKVAFAPVINATSPVPEPATWAMMIFGFGGVGHAMRRRPAARVRIRFA